MALIETFCRSLVPFFTAGTSGGEPVDFASKEAEIDHKKQEEVLRRFRMHECNVLVSTSILEEGADIPRANLVVRFDVPSNFPSYVHSLGRCRSTDANYVHLVSRDSLDSYLGAVAKYRVMSEVSGYFFPPFDVFSSSLFSSFPVR